MPQGTCQRAGPRGGVRRAGAMNPLPIQKAELGRGARIPLTVLRDNAEVVARFAADVLAEYQAALAAEVPEPALR